MGFLITNLKTEKTLYRGVHAHTYNTNTERNKNNKRFIIAYYTCDVIFRTDWEQRQS